MSSPWIPNIQLFLKLSRNQPIPEDVIAEEDEMKPGHLHQGDVTVPGDGCPFCVANSHQQTDPAFITSENIYDTTH